ncbi:MAG: hypothetical protein AAB805_00665 [Patescibacteria group bacterium]
MNERTIIHEIIVAICATLVLLVLWNPFGFWMPDTITYIAVGGLAVLFLLFAGLVWREEYHDEREEYHALVAARFGYTAGLLILLGAIAYEAAAEFHVNQFLLLALGGMIVAKALGHMWGRLQR